VLPRRQPSSVADVTGKTSAQRWRDTSRASESRLATSIRSSYLDVDGTLTFDQADGGTRMHWSWNMRLRGAMRVLSPVVSAIGPEWEHRTGPG
jgi:hypothetical protein